MRILVSLISFLFTLAGCDPQPGITTMTFSSVDGVKINSTKSRISNGDARFECLKSVTGSCHYLVYVETCVDFHGKLTQGFHPILSHPI